MHNVTVFRLGRAELLRCSSLSRAITIRQTPVQKPFNLTAQYTTSARTHSTHGIIRASTAGKPCYTTQRQPHLRSFSDRKAPDSIDAKFASPEKPSQSTRPHPSNEQHSENVQHGTNSPSSPPDPAKPLPSQHILQRSTLAARFNSNMDRLLNALAHLSQRVNIYTGTDYSGISSLRTSITEQEKHVTDLHTAVSTAKAAHAAAVTAQSVSNKEVVRLLERKNSWTDADLERYMSLIRSEHENEQAVQSAADAIVQAERALEEARAVLERTERKQYHEEQIWSDTIRRNSTWVTFGLMGFNIVLLLASLVVIEPWRRRRLVREIRSTLADSANASLGVVVPGSESSSDTVMALSSTDQKLASAETGRSSAQVLEENQSSAELPIAQPSPSTQTELAPRATAATPTPHRTDSWTGTFAFWKAYWADLFSERAIALRRVDLTAATLEGAAAGAAFMGLVFVFLRPR